ncbi:hypothetical protein HHI36_009549 [Cryptolaemus montrouzieri]|uniref:Rab proteins geranylgeranyltransferase component A n=1 Tax=Cryptolaemus montrouzieri TaxID=559131 RepID=A0ABD2MG15_9CUCU
MDYDLPTGFDLIIVGTGVVESIISAAASRIGKRVLQVDTNNYYGGHWASFNLEDIQNLKQENNIDLGKQFPKNLSNEEDFIPLGNKLKCFPYFETEWHIAEEDSIDVLKIKQENLNGKENVVLDEGDKSKLDNDKKEHDDCADKEEDESVVQGEIEEAKEVEQNLNVSTQELLKKDYRKFVIDLCPKLHFARGNFVELLISSNIARYAEFRSVSRVLTWINGNIEVVPCSRSDVFANNKVSVVEKRMLMKLLTSIEEEEKSATVPQNTTFKDFLKNKKLSSNIIHFVLYALSMSNDETIWLEGMKRTKRFLGSLGRFGKTPFLFSMYGSGEITQAFCRLSAVFGGVFALNQQLHGIVLNKENRFESLKCGKQNITASHIVMSVGAAPVSFFKNPTSSLISRAVLITDKSLMDSEQEHMTLLLYPAGNKLITILELGHLTGTCPKNVFLIHITTEGSSNPKEDLEGCVKNLFAFGEQDSNPRKPKVLWSSYFSIPNTNELDLKSSVPSNVFLCPGPDLDLDYDFSLEKAREIFLSIYPDAEFLPRAPDADEIVIGEDPETATEVRASNSNLDISKDTEKSVEEERAIEQSSETELAIEARASCSELDTPSETDNTTKDALKEVEECAEAKENMQ